MSLRINVDKVTAVVLKDVGLCTVKSSSFEIDAYEFVDDDNTLLVGGGSVVGVVSTGASWISQDGEMVFCPLTSIIAVKYDKE